MSDTTLKKIKEVIAEKLGCAQDIIKPESKFVDDLKADSLDIVELLMAIEEELILIFLMKKQQLYQQFKIL